MFTQYRGAPALSLVKLDPTTGAMDTAFASEGFSGDVEGIVVTNGSVYVAGSFSLYGTTPALDIVKVDAATGAVDTTFVPGPDHELHGFNDRALSIALVGGALWLGGNFTVYGGHDVGRLAKLDDTFAVDTTFTPPNTPAFDDGRVLALAAAGSSLYVGGWFSAYRGVADSAHGLAKLDWNTGAIDTTFSPPGSTSNGFVLTNVDQVSALVVAGASLYSSPRTAASRIPRTGSPSSTSPVVRSTRRSARPARRPTASTAPCPR